MKLQKIICWCIWNERNHRIFQDKFQPTWKIADKANALLGEVVSISKIPNNKEKPADTKNNWMQSLNISAANSMKAKKSEDWEIRMDKSQFENWLRERKIFKLFFDGASKGNPGRAGGGRIILDSRGKVEIEYYWNIGYNSNNMAEVYGIWQGLKQLKKKEVEEVLVFGDSRFIIQALNGGRKGKNERTTRLIKRIRSLSKMFRKINFFHILREINVKVDLAANKSIVVGLNELIINRDVSIEIPP